MTRELLLPPSFKRHRLVLIFMLIAPFAPVQAGTAPSLEAAIAERDKGRSFRALAILKQLGQASPDSNRIRLETALVRVQLKQYDHALKTLNEVLEEPGQLPPKVRVNVQLLVLKIRRLQQQQEDAAFTYNLKLGASHHSTFKQTLIDTGARVQNTLSLSAVDLAGYPLTTNWVNQGGVSILYYPASEDADIEFDVGTSLSASLFNIKLRSGIAAYLTETGSEPALTLIAGWRPESGFKVIGHIEQRWLDSGRTRNQHQLQLNLFNNQRVQAQLSYRGQSLLAHGQRVDTHRLGAALAHGRTQRWTLGGDWALQATDTNTESEYYLRGAVPLTNQLELVTDLRHLSYSQHNNGWFGRLGILWQR